MIAFANPAVSHRSRSHPVYRLRGGNTRYNHYRVDKQRKFIWLGRLRPGAATASQIKDVVVNYLALHPEQTPRRSNPSGRRTK
jgi:hypothetical protein